MRKSINDLQKTAFTFEKITKKTVLTICKIPDPDEIIKILNTCIKKDLVTSNEYLTDIISQGYDYLDIINGFINVLTNYDICEKHKLQLIDIANNTKIIVSTGLKSKLQLTAMICRLIDYISKNDIN
jgi:replication factor C subunit 2/4